MRQKVWDREEVISKLKTLRTMYNLSLTDMALEIGIAFETLKVILDKDHPRPLTPKMKRKILEYISENEGE